MRFRVSSLTERQVADPAGLQSAHRAAQIHQGVARPLAELARAVRPPPGDSQSGSSAVGAWSVSGLLAFQSSQGQEQPCGLLADGSLQQRPGLPDPVLRAALGESYQLAVQQDGLLALQPERASLPELLVSPPKALARLPAAPDALPSREPISSQVSRQALLWLRLSSPASPLPRPLPHPPAHENACEPSPPAHAPANSSASSSQ